MRIAVLALQGAFEEHCQMLHMLDVEVFQVRTLADLHQPMDGIILPGGESTAMMRIMKDTALVEPLQKAIANGLPVFGTCAGMILLDEQHLGCMDITVKRNAYGRQLGSFRAEHGMEEVGRVPMVFIRAPYIERWGVGVSVLSILDGHAVAARQQSMLVCSFHPELTLDTRVHQYWLSAIVSCSSRFIS
jgi:5'-phosphate synthase pdxT subunit